MSELRVQRWAVISERGCEADGLLHEEAALLARRLAGEGVSGLCVVTQEAARRLTVAAQTTPNGRPASKKPARQKRTAKQPPSPPPAPARTKLTES